MTNSQKIHKVIFTITPNANGYVVGCNQIPSLFTDVSSVANIDSVVRGLLSEYIDNFPDDAQKRGIGKNMPIETVWRASPNSVALE